MLNLFYSRAAKEAKAKKSASPANVMAPYYMNRQREVSFFGASSRSNAEALHKYGTEPVPGDLRQIVRDRGFGFATVD